jgi:branched-chain amino acid transport system ATP-binding protein
MKDTEKALIEARHLNKSFGGLRAVNDVSFDVSRGKIKAFIGPNGAGKSTLFNLISGTLRPSSGSVRFQNETITGLPDYAIAGKGIARTFQTTRLFHNMTVLENVMVGRHTRSGSGFVSSIFKLPRTRREEAEIREKARATCELMGLAGCVDANAGNLPFGKQRLVEIARALASEPAVLLLDEPAAGLNLHETEELGELIGSIRDMDVTVLIVEHDISLIMNISDEVLVLDRGRKLAEGAPREIQRNEEVIKIYLGEDNA